MAPLPVNNTSRYIITYVANGREHDVSFRYGAPGDTDPPGLVFLTAVGVVLTAAQALMPTDWTLLTARYIPSGSAISITTGLPPGSYAGTITPAAGQAPGFVTMIGRSVGGRQARFTLLGAGLDASSGPSFAQDYRISAAESSVISGLRTALDVSDVRAIDGLVPNWYGYANVGYNAHWQRAVRS